MRFGNPDSNGRHAAALASHFGVQEERHWGIALRRSVRGGGGLEFRLGTLLFLTCYDHPWMNLIQNAYGFWGLCPVVWVSLKGRRTWLFYMMDGSG